MYAFSKRQIVAPILVAFLWGPSGGMAYAQSDFEYYLFGVKLGSFQESNWLEITAGMTASVLTHELGHVLYLELAGKSWDARYSFPSELAIHTDDSLTDGEAANFGRAGFVLQTAIGTVLSSWEATRRSDFVKGWVAMNAVEAYAYKSRPRKIGDDFALIERGGGNDDLEFAAFTFMALSNVMRLDSGSVRPLTHPGLTFRTEGSSPTTDAVGNIKTIFSGAAAPSHHTTSFAQRRFLEFNLQESPAEFRARSWTSPFAEWEANHYGVMQ